MHGNVAGDHHRERAGDYTRAQSCPILLIVSPMYDTTVNLREQSASVHQLRRLLDAESADDCRGREREDIQTLSSPLRSTPIPRGLHSVPLQIHSSPSSTFLPSRGVFVRAWERSPQNTKLTFIDLLACAPALRCWRKDKRSTTSTHPKNGEMCDMLFLSCGCGEGEMGRICTRQLFYATTSNIPATGRTIYRTAPSPSILPTLPTRLRR